jgi:hypothetical protein
MLAVPGVDSVAAAVAGAGSGRIPAKSWVLGAGRYLANSSCLLLVVAFHFQVLFVFLGYFDSLSAAVL